MPPGTPEPRAALEMVARICDAIDYAHQRGVLHRDLKPSNVTVDEQGDPHILDFGLAKTFDPASSDGSAHGTLGITVSGPDELMGTVAYMAPEQARGQHDQTSVRTDVYSLGAIAYELLTGRLPCEVTGSLRDVLARILEQDPKAPSTIRRALSRDLDAVLLRALEKSPERRYVSAGEFAADIRRALAGQPVVARRVGTAGRAWRWVNRNRAISTVAASAVVALLAVSTILIARIIRESHIAAAERDDALDSLNRFRTTLNSVDPEKSGGVSVLEFLDMANKGLKDAPPKNERAEAQFREVLGTVYRKFADYPKAIDNQTRVLAIAERRADGRDSAALADALHNLAATYWWEGDYNRAEGLYMRSLAMRQRLFPGDNSDVAYSLTHLAACRIRLGKLGEARTLYQEALDMRRRLFKGDHLEVAQALNNLARACLEADQLDTAQTLFQESLDMHQRIEGKTERSGHPGTAFASMNLGDCFFRRSETAEIAGDSAASRQAAADARDAYQRAVDIRTEAFKAATKGHHLLAASLASLARAQLRLGDAGAAVSLAGRALEMFRATRRADHPDMVEGLETLALVSLAQADSAGASDLLRQALAIAEKSRPPSEPQLRRLRGELGLSLARTAHGDEGETLVITSLEDTRKDRGDRATETILAARRAAEFFAARGQPDRAAPYRALGQLH
jgi:tetratricopeptide (TPR) repeat protein